VTDPAARIEELRARIGENDRAIVAGVNERLRLVRELWALKDAHGTDRVDPDRERRLREELGAANEGPLTEEGLDRLVTELLALTKRELGSTP
jgi:chorismate mutase